MREYNVAVIGCGHRGRDHVYFLSNQEGVNIKALCDLHEDKCELGAKKLEEKGLEVPSITTDYKEILKRDDIDIVVVVTSWATHIEIAVDAMKAGKIVVCEVGGAYSVEECWDLVNTYEETKVPFMLFENCCFGKTEMLVRNMVQDGVLGEIVNCHGAYGHDLRKEVTGGKENRHYRLNEYLTRNRENYPTHELGPIAKILGINRGNKMNRLVSFASKSAGIKQYIEDRKDTIVNKDLIGVEFKQGDIVETLITCENGETISIKLDTCLPRPYSREFTVHGTKGLYEENTNSVFMDGEKECWISVDHYKEAIDNATEYEEKYLPDCWKNLTEEQKEEGHGGMDYFTYLAFFDALRNNKPMPIDVYDAAAWMCVSALSEESIKNGTIVEVPDFTRGKWNERETLNC